MFIFLGVANHTFNFAATNTSLQAAVNFVTNHFPGDPEEINDAIFGQYPGNAVTLCYPLQMLYI